MNQVHKKLLCLVAVMNVASAFAVTTSKIVPRSQSLNGARQIVGWNNVEWGINRIPGDDYYSSFNIIFEYTRTFRDNRLARCLFGDDLICNCDDLDSIRISGSARDDRAATDWLADYFGLPRDYKSTVSFKPTISNFIVDFSYYVGLDDWLEGLYFRVHGPFVHTRWSLNAQEKCEDAGSLGYFQGYFFFDDSLTNTDLLNKRFLDYTNGCTPNTEDIELLAWQSLCCSKISDSCGCDDTLTRNGFGELRFALGWNFIYDDEGDYHVGLGIYGAAPTGTRPGDEDCDGKGRYLFEPIVGNGKHWELGGQGTAHYVLWRDEEEDKSWTAYMQGNVSHLFGVTQIRCFDLCSAGSNSRYMLAQRLQSNRLTTDPVDGATLEFANEYAPVANITRRPVRSRIAVQADIAATLSYQRGNFQWDLGYDFWGRSCEDLCINECCEIDTSDWALKGDQRVFGFDGSTPKGLAVTDSKADIHQGSNMANGVSYEGAVPTAPKNEFADTAVVAMIESTPLTTLPSSGSAEIYTSNRPIIIKESDFDLRGTKGLSHKLFTHFNWKRDPQEDSNWTPYFGVGGEVEFGKTESSCCDTDCNTDSCCSSKSGCAPAAPVCTPLPRRQASKTECVDCAISQWGVWLKMGASYN